MAVMRTSLQRTMELGGSTLTVTWEAWPQAPTQSLADLSWGFLVKQALLARNPEWLSLVLSLAQQDQSSWQGIQAQRLDYEQVLRLVEWLDGAIAAGRIQVQPHAWDTSPGLASSTLDQKDDHRSLDDLDDAGPMVNDLNQPSSHATYHFRVVVLDEIGTPVPGVDVQFEFGSIKHRATTDGQGKAQAQDMPASIGTVTVKNESNVRESLQERWSVARGKPWYEHPNAEVTYVAVRHHEDFPAFAVAADIEHTMVLQPRVTRVRCHGSQFETSKCFVMPNAIENIKEIASIYNKNRGTDLLIVGHTDEAGDPSYNDPLSVERAEAMAAYLTNDVEAWYDWYSSAKDYQKRWGNREDGFMIDECAWNRKEMIPVGHDKVTWYQKTRGLKADGIAGPITRHALIEEYMNIDNTTLPSDIRMFTHGCGENFPLPPGEKGGSNETSFDRRVELFFFENPARAPKKVNAVLPEPLGRNSGPGSKAYPEWILRVQETQHLWAPPQKEPLNVFFPIPQDVEGVELLILDSDEDIHHRLPVEAGRQSETTVSFTLPPERLPNPCIFQVFSELEEDAFYTTHPLDPGQLRDNLKSGEQYRALNEVDHERQEPSGGPDWGAIERNAEENEEAANIVVKVSWMVPKFDFEVKLLVKGAKDGSVKPDPDSKGSATFEIEPLSVTKKVKIELWFIHSGTNETALKCSQEFLVDQRIESDRKIIPTISNFPSQRLHARINKLGFSVGKAHIFQIAFDTTFIGVTELVQKISPQKNEVSKILKRPLDLGYGSLYILVSSVEPRMWFVFVPNDVETIDKVSIFVPFRHELLGGWPKALAGCDLVHMLWYLRENPKLGTFFPFDVGFRSYPFAWWPKQIAKSGKKIVMCMPIPNVTNFGVVNSPAGLGSNRPSKLLKSLMLALFCDKSLQNQAETRPTKVGKLAIAGWSSGTDTVYNWCKSGAKDAKLVDELYLLDGKSTAGSPIPWDSILKAWHQKKTTRRIRNMATSYTLNYSMILKKHWKGESFYWSKPEDSHYWGSDPVYLKALIPLGNSSWKFSKKGEPPSNATSHTGIYLDSEHLDLKSNNPVSSWVVIAADVTNANGKLITRKHKLGMFTHPEVAVLTKAFVDPHKKRVKGKDIKFPYRKITTEALFIELIQYFSEGRPGESSLVFAHRHAWSPCATENGKGLLQLALEDSQFLARI
jgi:outer membrane protein OmpA-like peptidoglycan-associated protein